MTIIEHQIRCVLCHGDEDRRRRATIGQVCEQCRDRLHERLDQIPRLWEPLAGMLAPSAGAHDGGSHRGKVDSGPPPLRVDVLNLIVPGATSDVTTEARSGPLPTVDVLVGWLRIVWEERGLDDDRLHHPTVAEAASLLRRHLDWICSRDWVDDFADDIVAAHNVLRDVHGEHRPKRIGTCQVQVDRAGDTVVCGTALYASAYNDEVRCRGCGERWSRDQWRWLGETMGVIAS